MECEIKTVEAEVEEGRQREDILNSFKGVGILQLCLGIVSFLHGILIVIIANVVWGGPGSGSRIGDGIWCSIFGIFAGAMVWLTSCNMKYCMVGWTIISTVIATFFTFIMVSIQLIVMIKVMYMDAFGMVLIHSLEMIFGSTQLSLCIYNLIVFIRLFMRYPYRSSETDCSLCPCCSCSNDERQNFAYVMYTSVNPKKHNA